MKEAFTKSEKKRLVKALEKRWGHLLEDETMQISGSIGEGFVQVELILSSRDQTLYYPMQCRVETEGQALEPYQAKDLAVDFLDWYLGEYLGSGREVLLRLDWEEVSFGEHKVFARGDVRNKRLEDVADAILNGSMSPEEAEELLKRGRE